MNHRSRIINSSIIIPSVALLAASWVSFVQAGPPWKQDYKLLASDGTTGSVFGDAVAIDGNIAIIGAEFGPGATTNSGAAYIFDVTTGQQLHKLLPDDNGASMDEFGFSVAIDGNVALVGDRWDDDNGLDSGSAYLFDVTTGQQLFKLLPSDGAAGSAFGTSAALRGNIALVGASGDEENGIASGSVYVFDVTTGTQLFKLRPLDAASGYGFGFTSSLSGNIAVIGAWGVDDVGENSGAAYVFDVTTGEQLLKLHASDAAPGDLFGNSVSIDGNTILVGAQFHASKGGNSGAAYVFDVTTGEQLFNLSASDASSGNEFGYSVAVKGNTAIISSIGDNAKGFRSGSAYVFDISTGGQLFKLVAKDGNALNGFGFAVATTGQVAIIGADLTEDQGKSSGSAYIFHPLNIADQLTVSPDPLIAGQNGTFSVRGALPNNATWLIYSLKGLQPGFINQLNTSIDLLNPVLADGPKNTDANGDLDFVLPIPNINNSLIVWLQSVQMRNSTISVATQIIP